MFVLPPFPLLRATKTKLSYHADCSMNFFFKMQFQCSAEYDCPDYVNVWMFVLPLCHFWELLIRNCRICWLLYGSGFFFFGSGISWKMLFCPLEVGPSQGPDNLGKNTVSFNRVLQENKICLSGSSALERVYCDAMCFIRRSRITYCQAQ